MAFIKNRKIYYIIAIAFIVIGITVGMVRGFNMGIDFTGGTMMQIDMGQKVEQSAIKDVLEKHGVEASIVFSGENNKEVIIKTVSALDTEARKEIISDMTTTFSLEDKDFLSIQEFGPSVGEMLKVNAIKALLIASIGMLIYIVVRFEWKFGIAAIVATLHDVLVLIAFYGLFGVTVNNPFIAALLTVVGYSINDTIVVFDRIRENSVLYRKRDVSTLINDSINQTLSRSIMTSATTLLVILPLFIFVSAEIREFLIPLLIGVSVGTYSSIFICSPVYYESMKKVGVSKYKEKQKKLDKSKAKEKRNAGIQK